MENKMKKVIISFLAFFSVIVCQAQITVTVGSALLQDPGTDVHLPVSVTGLNGAAGGKGVTGIELHVGYTNTILVYDTTLNFSSLVPASQWFYGANGIEYSTNWLEPSGNKLNIPDNTVLFEVVLHYLGSSTELVFDTARCLLIDSIYNIIPGVHYVNGMVTPSQGTGESRWNGTGPWNTISNWSNGIPGDSTNAIIETGEVTANSNAVCKSITINPGSTVDISANFSLTANRNYVNNGILNLLSDASGTGSMIVLGSVSGSGVNNFNRYLDFTAGFPYLVSSPVTGETASVLAGYVAEKYIENSASFTALASTDNLETATGYRLSGTIPATFSFQGLFNTGDVTKNNLSYTASAGAGLRGLNLLGNPYPSAIQWEQGNWGRTNLDYAVYVWSGYKYVTWNGSIGALTDGIIPAMQGFFVKSSGNGASLTIPAGSRLHSTQPFYKSADVVSGMISMKLENSADTNHFDETFVHILNGSTAGFDSNLDAWKLFGNDAYPQIYTKTADQGVLSINTQPELTSVLVEYKAGTAGSYKISFGNIESFDQGQPLYFEDKTTSTVINLRNTGEFVFASDGTPETGRFVLHFKEVGMEEPYGSIFTVWNTGNVIHITPKTGNYHVDLLEIFNITGQLVHASANIDLPATIRTDNLSNGMYFLRIKTTTGGYTHKLIVR